MERQMTLPELYDKYLKEFKRNGTRPKPELLLALLLLQDKDNFQGANQDAESYYKQNKFAIDQRIEKVMKDFSITKDYLRNYCCSVKIEPMNLTDGQVIFKEFEMGIITLMCALNAYPRCNSEEAYNELHNLVKGEPLPQIRDNEIPYSQLSTLQRRYRQYLNRFKRDGKIPRLDKLLALLLLSQKDDFLHLVDGSMRIEGTSPEEFYLKNQQLIEEGIKKVMTDFCISEDTLPSIYEKLLEKEKISPITYNGNVTELKREMFANAWKAAWFGLDLYPNGRPEAIYAHYSFMFGEDLDENYNELGVNCWVAGIEDENFTKTNRAPKTRRLRKKSQWPTIHKGNGFRWTI